MTKFDKDHDGKISFEEFEDWMFEETSKIAMKTENKVLDRNS